MLFDLDFAMGRTPRPAIPRFPRSAHLFAVWARRHNAEKVNMSFPKTLNMNADQPLVFLRAKLNVGLRPAKMHIFYKNSQFKKAVPAAPRFRLLSL